MITNFEQWKKDIIESYYDSLHFDIEQEEAHQQVIKKFCKCVNSVEYKVTKEVAEVLLSLFTNEEDYEMLESVIDQLDHTSDVTIFPACLINAFPRLAKEAAEWAEVFLRYFIDRNYFKQIAISSKDKKGKISMINFIKTRHSSEAFKAYEKYETLKRGYAEDLKRFDAFAEELKESMTNEQK